MDYKTLRCLLKNVVTSMIIYCGADETFEYLEEIGFCSSKQKDKA